MSARSLQARLSNTLAITKEAHFSGGEGIRTPGGVTPTAVFKTGDGLSDCAGFGGAGHERDTKAAAVQALELLECIELGKAVSSGNVAALAAEVLSNPPPLTAAAQRYLRTVGTEHEGAPAVEFLALLSVPRAGVWGPIVVRLACVHSHRGDGCGRAIHDLRSEMNGEN